MARPRPMSRLRLRERIDAARNLPALTRDDLLAQVDTTVAAMPKLGEVAIAVAERLGIQAARAASARACWRSAAKQIASTSARSRVSASAGSACASSVFNERPRLRTASSTRAATARGAAPLIARGRGGR